MELSKIITDLFISQTIENLILYNDLPRYLNIEMIFYTNIT